MISPNLWLSVLDVVSFNNQLFERDILNILQALEHMRVGLVIGLWLNDDDLFAAELIENLKAVFVELVLQYFDEDADGSVFLLLLVHFFSIAFTDHSEENLLFEVVGENNQLTKQ
jgi:hypothetical protein